MSAIVARFAQLRRTDPDRPLIHLPGPDSTLSASDIWASHLEYADRLSQAGIGPHQLIVSACGNSPASVAFLLACRVLDVAVMPVDAGTTVAEVLELAARFGAAALVTRSAMASGVRQAGTGRALPLPSGLCLLPRDGQTPHLYPDAALLKLSSGSTGAPKAALTSDAQLAADGMQIAAAMGTGPDDTQIAAIPLSHAYGLSVLVMPLLLQGTPFVLRESFVPHQIPADARRFNARRFPGVPFMFQYFVANPPADGWPPALARLVSAGAKLPTTTVREFHDRFGVKIHSFYGTTEAGGIAFDDGEDIDERATVGRAIEGVTITLRHESGLAPNTGRVHVRSAGVASGYAGHAGGGFEDGGFLTGDYGMFDGGRRLTLIGRVSSFVNVAGRKVEPTEVEDVLRSMPGIVDVTVVAAPEARRGQQVVACVVTDAATSGPSVLEVRRFCAARLAPHKIPRAVIFLNAIPLTARGKTDRTALDAIVRAHLGG